MRWADGFIAAVNGWQEAPLSREEEEALRLLIALSFLRHAEADACTARLLLVVVRDYLLELAPEP